MLPTPDSIIEQVRTGKLLGKDQFATLDLDEILEARDSDAAFEREWLGAQENLATKWEGSPSSRVASASVEELRRESFLAVSVATNQHELSSYVSDDFELIAKASLLGDVPPVVAWLWRCYRSGTTPRPDQRDR